MGLIQTDVQESLVGFGQLDTPEQIRTLGCPVQDYRMGLARLRQLHLETIKWQSVYMTLGCGMSRRDIYGQSSRVVVVRTLTVSEFKRVLWAIKKFGLIVSSFNPNYFNGVGYWLWTNPYRDALAANKHKVIVGKPEEIFLLRHEMLTAEHIKGAGERVGSEERVTKIFQYMEPISHNSLNVAWCEHYGLDVAELRDCYY